MDTNTSKYYPVMEDFYTIQGEGFFAGHAAYFIRLGGCDVGCTWCDVKESWDESKHPQISTIEIIDKVKTTAAKICVITGGEPLMHDLSMITNELKKANISTHIETSGTAPLSGDLDWITFSPKRFKKPLEEFYRVAHELKIIVAHSNDLRWALEHGKKINPACKLYLQPEWDKQKEILPAIVDFVKANPQWQISLQTHKFIGVD